MTSTLRTTLFATSFLFLLISQTSSVQADDWPTYAGSEGGTRYSAIDQINTENADQLEVAWTYRTGAMEKYPQLNWALGFQATPILLPEDAGQHLVLCTPWNEVVALDPETGAERWRFDPKISPVPFAGRFNCRGVTHWEDLLAEDGAACRHRIVLATNDRKLWAIDAKDGLACEDFGEAGVVDVTPIIKELKPANQLPGMQLLSPVAIVNGVIVIGGTANKFRDVSSMNGALRAFDARTGELKWVFDTLIREPVGDPEASDFSVGGANVWINMSWDSERDLVFVPTASAAPNYYGANRPGNNRYANSILAIRASTGELVWHYQLLHHDVWDWDLPTNPILAEITKDGEKVPVVIQLTKQGMVFVFHRETGEPYFEIEERPVPTDGMPGDQLSPTQPFPVAPPPLVRQGISADDAWGVAIYDWWDCKKQIESMRHGEIFTPITTEPTIMFPQVGGGMNWGGGAFDPETNTLVTPVGQFPYWVKLIPNDEIDPKVGKDPRSGTPDGPPGFIDGTEYGLQQGPLLSPFGAPCTEPPWAKLVGVDLTDGTIKWEVPLGIIDKLAPIPIPMRWGTPFAGGAIVTKGGVAFIGATPDERFRAYDISNGDLLWEFDAPTSANATPMTYMINGRQYVVVATGGHGWLYPQGLDDYVMAYALPEKD